MKSEKGTCRSEPEPRRPAHSRDERIERLFREHNRALLRFLMTCLHSEQEARDVAQEAYVRLLNLDNADAVSYLRAFLFRIAANLANDRVRQRKRRRELRDLVFFEQESARSPEHEHVAREELAIIRRAVGELPPKCQTAFVLIKFRQMSFAEAAERMRLSSRMVRVYVTRALEHCQLRVRESNQAGTEKTNG